MYNVCIDFKSVQAHISSIYFWFFFFFTWAGFCTAFLSEQDLVVWAQPVWTWLELICWMVMQATDQICKWCHCLPLLAFLSTHCLCMSACLVLSDMDTKIWCCISSLSGSYSAARNDTVSGFNTYYASTCLCEMQHDTVCSCFLLCILGKQKQKCSFSIYFSCWYSYCT